MGPETSLEIFEQNLNLICLLEETFYLRSQIFVSISHVRAVNDNKEKHQIVY